MADTVTARTLFQGDRRLVLHLTGYSDGTGETSVVKLARSGIKSQQDQRQVTRFVVESIQWNVDKHAGVHLQFNRTSPTEIAVLSRADEKDYRDVGGLVDQGTGSTGDLILSTIGPVSGGTYDILLNLRLKYD